MSKAMERAAIAAFILAHPDKVTRCPPRIAANGGSLQIKNPPAKR